jgi:hypothetical protein
MQPATIYGIGVIHGAIIQDIGVRIQDIGVRIQDIGVRIQDIGALIHGAIIQDIGEGHGSGGGGHH